MEKIRILLAEDHIVVREGTKKLLESQPDFEVVGEANDGEEAIELTKKLRPELVIMDISMPKLSGIEATKQWIVPSGKGGVKLDGFFGFFDKALLMDVVPTDGNIELKVAGKLKSGQYFYGCDTVKVIK